MIIIRTIYPCQKCNEEIDPGNAFCPHCGEKQPELSGRTHYNLVCRRSLEGPYNMKYGGHILTMADISDLVSTDPTPENYQCFVIGYVPAENKNSGLLNVRSMFLAVGPYISENDFGPQSLEITHLE